VGQTTVRCRATRGLLYEVRPREHSQETFFAKKRCIPLLPAKKKQKSSCSIVFVLTDTQFNKRDCPPAKSEPRGRTETFLANGIFSWIACTYTVVN